MTFRNYSSQGHYTSSAPKQEPVAALPSPAQPRRKRLTALPPQPVRILLVDDDERILNVLATHLRHEGYKIETAHNGEEGLIKLDEFSPDVMCIDLMMPRMDGQELARQIRARRDLLYVPIVMLTAANSHDTLKIANMNSGVDAVLSKPVKRDELLATIRTMVRMKAAQDKMLEALERVAEAQDDLLEYERQQGQYEAMRATIATVMKELTQPLNVVNSSTNMLEKVVEAAESGQYETEKINAANRNYLQKIKDALTQIDSAMARLNEVSQFTTKELPGDQLILDLDPTQNER